MFPAIRAVLIAARGTRDAYQWTFAGSPTGMLSFRKGRSFLPWAAGSRDQVPRRPWGHAIVVAGVLSAGLLAGCSIPSNRLDYPVVPSAQRHTALRFDNRIDPSSFWTPFVYIEVWVDGIQPTERHYLPLGVTELRLAPGRHEIIHRGVTPGGLGGKFSVGYSATDPRVIDAALEEGRSYTLSFRFTGSALKGRYVAQYEGWSADPDGEAAAAEEHTVHTHLWEYDPFWEGPGALRAAARKPVLELEER